MNHKEITLNCPTILHFDLGCFQRNKKNNNQPCGGTNESEGRNGAHFCVVVLVLFDDNKINTSNFEGGVQSFVNGKMSKI